MAELIVIFFIFLFVGAVFTLKSEVDEHKKRMISAKMLTQFHSNLEFKDEHIFDIVKTLPLIERIGRDLDKIQSVMVLYHDFPSGYKPTITVHSEYERIKYKE